MKIDKFGMLFAEVTEYESGVTVLEVYRSVIVSEDGELYAPVRAFLAEHPHELISEQEHRDENYYGNSAVRRLYKLV
ncbi:hypothetical protein [Nocardia salmonicida]|uniref:hypothetical protein n=1 Tax=Nocardia salmonicida TaxID=53431 RepID=UPI0037B5FB6D